MTRYETRQFAPVRISDAMPYQKFSRYKSETKKIMGDNDLIGELQQSILNELEEIAERAVALERAAEEEVGNEFRQVENLRNTRRIECRLAMVVRQLRPCRILGSRTTDLWRSRKNEIRDEPQLVCVVCARSPA